MKEDSNGSEAGERTPESHHSSEEGDSPSRLLPEVKKKVIKPRASVSAEVFGGWNKRGVFVPKMVPKDAETERKLTELLGKSFMFKFLNEDEMKIVTGAMEGVDLQAKQQVIGEGEDGDCIYVVESGELDCTKVIKGVNTHLKVYYQSDVFGELALLYNCKRAATITAKSAGKLWKLDREAFNHIVKDSARK